MFNRLRTIWLVACILLALLLAGVAQAATTLNFTLPTGASTYWTSAAVYDSNGTLVRTLWRHVQKNVGANTATWDNLNDAGTACAAGTYTIKVLYHNVNYQVLGTVGNTSSVLSDSAYYWRSFVSPMAMANAGSTGSPLFVVSGYNEMQSGCKKLDPSTPQQATNWFRQDCFTAISRVATDGTNVYLATRPAIQAASVFVFAISATQYSTFSSFANGTDLRLNGNYEDQHYPSVIDLSTVASGTNTDYATGLAVQRSGQGAGNLLAVSHATLNTVRLYNKTTGELLTTIPVTNPGDVAFANNGDLWIITGTSVLRYDVNGTPTLLATIAGLSGPVNIATHPASDLVLVADGGTSQQVKAFANVTSGTVSTPTWTYGLAGGWRSNGVTAANNKFGFYRTCSSAGITDPVTPLVVLADGSFWVGDTECNRLLHFDAARNYLERIMYRPASYTAAVDTNTPTRMFSDFIEYQLDYSKPLQPGDPEATGGNGCWRFVKNWAAGQEISHADVIYCGMGGVKPVYTLSNGRTYGVVKHSDGSREIVELAASGLRFTGITLTNTAENLYPDGSRRYISAYTSSGTVTWYKRALTGFDATGNPQWAAATTLATAPADARTPNTRASYIHPIQFPITANNVLIAFDPSKNYAGAGLPYTWHLGGVTTGTNSWQWQGSPAVNGEVPFLGVGNYDVGDGVQYAGAAVGAAGDQVVYAYTGEFYNGGQASQWMHFMDDGLFVGQFGVPGYPSQAAKPIGFAGNIYASDMYSTGGEYYVYANDESNVAGVMLWKLTGANAIAKLAGSGTLNSTITLGTQVATPTFSVTPGTYTVAPYVTLSCATSGATIRYTTDGSTPTPTHGTVGTSVTLSQNTTLQAIAYKTGMTDSFIASGVYNIRCALPAFSPAVGTYTSAQTVTISSATSGVTIRYTTDGTTPTQSNGTIGTTVNISAGCTLQAIAYKTGMTDSLVAVGGYEIHGNGTNTTNLFTGLTTGDMPNAAPWTRSAADTHYINEPWNDFYAHFDATTQQVTVQGTTKGAMSVYRDIAGLVAGSPTSVTISGTMRVSSSWSVAGIKLKSGSTTIATLQSNNSGVVTLNGATFSGVDGRNTNSFSLSVSGTTITGIVNGVTVTATSGQKPLQIEIFSTNDAASRTIVVGSLQLDVVYGTTTNLYAGLTTGDMPNTAPWTRSGPDVHYPDMPWNDAYAHFDATAQTVTVRGATTQYGGPMSVYRDITDLVSGTPSTVTVSGTMQVDSSWEVAGIRLKSGGTTIATLQSDRAGVITLNGAAIPGMEGRYTNNFTLAISGSTITAIVNGVTATTTGGQKPLQIEIFSTGDAAARTVVVGNLQLSVQN